MKEQLKSALFGFVIGDAMGVPIEFKSRKILQENPTTTMLGFGSHDVPPGCWSDDTSMTLATMDSIICSHGINYNDIANHFLYWVNEDRYTATNCIFDIGMATRKALMHWEVEKKKSDADATICGGSSFYDNGNGSLMRMLPIVFYLNTDTTSYEQRYMIIKNTSSITHKHEISILGCLIYTDFLLGLLQGKTKEQSYNDLQEKNYINFDKDTLNMFRRIWSKELLNSSSDTISSSGYVVDTLESVLWVTLTTDNFYDAIVTAINLGDDTDTVGAITGSIVGLLYGYDSIPHDWLYDLIGKEYLDEIINSFHEYLSIHKEL